jgi:hypothetical protein
MALVAGDPGTHVRLASLRTIAVLDCATAARVAAAYVDAPDTDLASAALAITREAGTPSPAGASGARA